MFSAVTGVWPSGGGRGAHRPRPAAEVWLGEGPANGYHRPHVSASEVRPVSHSPCGFTRLFL